MHEQQVTQDKAGEAERAQAEKHGHGLSPICRNPQMPRMSLVRRAMAAPLLVRRYLPSHTRTQPSIYWRCDIRLCLMYAKPCPPAHAASHCCGVARPPQA